MRTARNRWSRCTAQPAAVDPDARDYEVSVAGLVALLEYRDPRPTGELWSEDRDDAGAYDRPDWTPGTACRPYLGAGR